MEVGSPAAKQPPAWTFRFSLAGLLVYMTALAVLFAAWKVPGLYSTDPWRAATTFLVLIGVAMQVRDLGRAGSSQPEFSRRIRWEQAWRVAAGVALLLFMSESMLQHVRLDWFKADDMNYELKNFTELGWFLVLFALLPLPYALADRYRNLWARSLGVAALLIAGAVLVVYIGNHTLVHSLVYVAIRGVEVTQSYRRGDLVFYDYQFFNEERRQLQQGAYIATGLLLTVTIVSWWTLHSQISRWKTGLQIFSVIGLIGLIPLTIWGRLQMTSVQPFHLPNLSAGNPYFWLNGWLLFGLVTIATAGVLLRDATPKLATGIEWRGPFGSYPHEQWPALVILGFGTLKPVYEFLRETWNLRELDNITEWDLLFWKHSLLDVKFVFSVLCLTRILGGCWQCFRRAHLRSFPSLPADLSPWSAFGTTLFVGILLAIWLHVAYWLSWVLTVEPTSL